MAGQNGYGSTSGRKPYYQSLITKDKMNECKKEYCEFIGNKAFEDDGGWSYEVWQAAQQAAFKRIADRFLGYGDIDYTGHEIARYITFLAKQDVS